MEKSSKQSLGFLLIVLLGVLLIQVNIGGITRLTGSGLSITDWHIVTGTLPPLNAAQWQVEFDQYQASPQFQQLNYLMTLSEFKFIYFWEWLHRVWGRLGFVFLAGIFGWFLLRRKLNSSSIRHFGILLFLYLCQGIMGWFMVMSGLSKIPQVSHYRLTAHLLLALLLFGYILYFASKMLVEKKDLVVAPADKKRLNWLTVLTLIQISFGAFMSGLKAATHYPSWPDMNGQIVPKTIFAMEPLWLNFFENIATIQFVHRGLAYILTALVIWEFLKLRKLPIKPLLRKSINAIPVLLFLQVGLGITVLLLSKSGTIPVSWGVIHQAVGLLLLSSLLFVNFQLVRE